MVAVEFEQVSKIFAGGSRALIDLDLRIEPGELLVVVGPSGCGKSTLLRLAAGLEEPTTGRIRIGDRVVNDVSPRDRNIAMVFQDYALYPHLSVKANLEFPLKMGKLSADETARRVGWAADILGLGDFLDRLPRELSGGQRQRVAMGRALVREPAVFLLDEPLSNLDAQLRSQVRAEIAELQRQLATTMIYVTHDQVEAMTLGDRVALLDAGRLQQVATPRELYDRPANTKVAGFVGTPPMNLLPVMLRIDERALRVEIAGRLLCPPAAIAAELIAIEAAPETMGVRPEDLSLAAGDDDGAFAATVQHVEYLGHETLLHAELAPDMAVVARLPGTISMRRGEPVSLRPEWSSVRLFAADGRALPWGR